jgi:hypothetical protein
MYRCRTLRRLTRRCSGRTPRSLRSLVRPPLNGCIVGQTSEHDDPGTRGSLHPQTAPSAPTRDASAASNIAAYRILSRHGLAFRWWSKGAELGDGDAFVEVGDCYQHGLGVECDPKASEQAYLAAIATEQITEFSREEAMYHLAVLRLQRGREAKSVVGLLRRASRDGDFPAAADLLPSLRARRKVQPCVCRRGLRRRIAILKCPVHRDALANKSLQTDEYLGRSAPSVGPR